MPEQEDWLQDPLIKADRNIFENRVQLNFESNQQERWASFHFATRLKLDGAVYFCRQVLGSASIPDDIGLYLLAHRQTRWYLEAFFFELMSAADTLLQEINVAYEYTLKIKPEQIHWHEDKRNKFMRNLPDHIFVKISEERRKEWFTKAQSYRNTATHHYTIPLSSGTTWAGYPINYSEFDVTMQYFNKDGIYQPENIKQCEVYLREMVIHIVSIWEIMARDLIQR